MNRFLLLITLIFTVLTLIYSLNSCRTTTSYVGGIQIDEFNQGVWAHTLKSSGMNTTQLTVYARQGRWNSEDLFWNTGDTTYMIEKIRILKKQKTKVVLVLRVSLQHNYDENQFKWHGMIYPTTKEKRDDWFLKYRNFTEMWAKICEQEGVDVFAISSEMSSLTGTIQTEEFTPLVNYYSKREKQLDLELKITDYQNQLKNHVIWEYGRRIDQNIRPFILEKIESNVAWAQEAFQTDDPNSIAIINEERKQLDSSWRELIANTRNFYSGQITMAANYDSYHDISFWDDLDFIGINAYFPLRTLNRQPISDDSIYLELVNGWESVFDQMKEFKSTQKLKNKPIFFTEIGYTAREFSTVTPWKGDGFSLVNCNEFDTLLVWNDVLEKRNERTMAINALYQVVNQEKIPLIGINYWKLSSNYWRSTNSLSHDGREPFMVTITKEEPSELQTALNQFLKKE